MKLSAIDGSAVDPIPESPSGKELSGISLLWCLSRV
jgi:hypothetical protein